MAILTLEGIVENGQSQLRDDVTLPERTKVYVVILAIETAPQAHIYSLVAQAQPMLEHYRRQTNGRWLYYSVHGLGEHLYLTSIECMLPLTEVYDRIAFPVEPPELPADA
jgi:hypothetical protein